MTTEVLDRPAEAPSTTRRPLRTMANSWADRIYFAEQRGHFDRDDNDAICKFRTCAVGEVYGFPLELGIADVPPSLRNPGMSMVLAVSRNNFGDARSLLREIETAALELI